MKHMPVVATLFAFVVLAMAMPLRAEDAAVEKTKMALKTKGTFEFVDTSLSAAIATIAAKAKIEVKWNAALGDTTKSVPVTLKVQDMECANVLAWLTKLSETAYRIDGDHIEITTPELLEAATKKKAK